MSSQITYIVHNCIGFRHQASDGRGMHNFTMVSTKTRPKSSKMHLKLIKTERPDTLQKGVEVVLEPTPDLASGNALGRRRIGTNGLLDGRKVGEMPDGNGLLWTHKLSRGCSVRGLRRWRLNCDASFLRSSMSANRCMGRESAGRGPRCRLSL
jgi:hypothetical protein